MPAYYFEALDAQGATQKGLIDADTARAARSMLRARALVPILVEPATGAGSRARAGGLNITLWGGRVFNATALAVWTRQISGLVAAGLPLERALAALTEEAENDAQRNLMASLRSEVNAGSPFARALSAHPREFSDIYTAVIAAGEQSGQLGTVLERLADDLEEREALKNKLIAASLYPAIFTLVAIVIVGFLVSYGWFLLGLLIAAAGALVMARRQPALRLRMDAAWLRLPLVGKLARGYNAARFAATLAMLAAAGVPILRALQTAAETLSNQAMRADALDELVLVREGAPLASAIASKKRFPPLVAMFARLGEQTGQLPTMLGRAAKQLGAEVQRRAMHLATILEPLLIVGMGAVVMLIVLAVLMPIIQLNQLVK